MIDLEEAKTRIGRVVVYHPDPTTMEQGVGTGVQGEFVFVRYGSDLGAKATRPQDLEWLAP